MRLTKEEQAAQAEMERLLAAAQQEDAPSPSLPHRDGRPLSPDAVVEILTPHLTDRRRERIEAVLAARTYTVATVVEGLANTGNVNAVMRTAEGLGYQGFHIITQDIKYKRSARTTQGADKWLDVRHWETPAACAASLKGEGYTLVVTHLDDTAVPIHTLDFTRKTALVFGNEREGASESLLAEADVRCILPMTGFVQSFNISVAAAIALYHAYQDRLTRQGYHGDLSDREKAILRATFYLRGMKHGLDILQKVTSRPSP